MTRGSPGGRDRDPPRVRGHDQSIAPGLPVTVWLIALTALIAAGCGSDDPQPRDADTRAAPLLCPRPFGARPVPDRRLDARTLIGLTEDAAARAAAEGGCSVRVTRRDGRSLPATRDFRPTRINVAVDDGVVTDVLGIN